MDKYEVLKGKLSNIIKYIDGMTIKGSKAQEYLLKYRKSIEERIEIIEGRKISGSNGALFGLLRGVSDYDEICKDIQFLKMLADADRYYSEDCYKF